MNTQLFLPRPNPYIPENLTVEKHDVSEVRSSNNGRKRLFTDILLIQPLKYPICIRETHLSSLWFKKDDQYWVPKGHIKVDIGRYRIARFLHNQSFTPSKKNIVLLHTQRHDTQSSLGKSAPLPTTIRAYVLAKFACRSSRR